MNKMWYKINIVGDVVDILFEFELIGYCWSVWFWIVFRVVCLKVFFDDKID